MERDVATTEPGLTDRPYTANLNSFIGMPELSRAPPFATFDHGLYRCRWRHRYGFGFIQSTQPNRTGIVWSSLVCFPDDMGKPNLQYTRVVMATRRPVSFYFPEFFYRIFLALWPISFQGLKPDTLANAVTVSDSRFQLGANISYCIGQMVAFLKSDKMNVFDVDCPHVRIHGRYCDVRAQFNISLFSFLFYSGLFLRPILSVPTFL